MDWLDLLKNSHEIEGPLYLQIMNRLKESIESGKLPDRSKLPTNRELATLLDVDRSTVSRAYTELVQAGLIESHVGRGTYVRAAKAKPKSHLNLNLNSSSGQVSWSEKFSRKSNTVADLLDQQSTYRSQPEGTISFAGGIPTEEFYPHEQFEEIVQQLLKSENAREMFSYSPAEGHPLLLHQVQKVLAAQGVSAADDEILIVSGSQQGIDLVTDILVDADDVVILEEPSYLWAVCNFKSRQANCLTVPVADTGIELGALEQMLSSQRAKLLYLMPNFQNPTGNSMTIENRQKVLALCARYGVPILEDNFAGDLSYEGTSLPPLRSLPGGKELVIYQGTFSKALCPGLRVGWLVAPREIMTRLRLAKRSCDLSTNSMAQVILAKYLEDGLYKNHVEHVKKAYRKRRDTMLGALERHLGALEGSNGAKVFWTRPSGGLFLWLTLPVHCSAKDLLLFAEREGVTFSSGELFYCNKPQNNCFRVCFIQQNEETIEEGVKRLSRAISTYFDSIQKRPPQTVNSERLRRPENVLI
jgi:2-aminoadipate transaminase